MSTRSEIVEIITALEDDVKQLKDEIAGLGVAHTVPAASESCTVADYLLERLVQLGVTVSNHGRAASGNCSSVDALSNHLDDVRSSWRFQLGYVTSSTPRCPELTHSFLPHLGFLVRR